MSSFEPEPDVFSDFPSFRPLFAPEPRYLALLHLPSADGLFEELAAALGRSPDPTSRLRALFQHRNHRCHLVAAATMLIADHLECLDSLWGALDAGTWASPQVAAVAFVLDAAFEERARQRLLQAGGFPKTVAALGALYRRLESPRLTVLARLDDPALKSPDGRDGACTTPASGSAGCTKSARPSARRAGTDLARELIEIRPHERRTRGAHPLRRPGVQHLGNFSGFL